MEYQDRVLKCAECNAEFIFTAGEQMFFADKGLEEPSGANRARQTAPREMEMVPATVWSVSKPRLFAPSAGRKQRYLSSRHKGDRFTAANASSRGGR